MDQNSQDSISGNFTYLGDAVFIRPWATDGGYELFTHNGLDTIDCIYLEPEVAQALVNWLAEQGIKCNH